MGNTYVYPFFNHAGLAGVDNFDPYVPKMCDCKTGTGNLPHCSEFDFVSGFLFFDNTTTLHQSFFKVLDLIYIYPAAKLNRLTFDATFAATRLGGRPNVSTFREFTNHSAIGSYESLSNKTWRDKAYDFCIDCNILTLRAFDHVSKTDRYRIDGTGLQLFNGSCNNIMNHLDKDVWAAAAKSPPIDLVQDYYECRADSWATLVSAVGVGVSDACIVVPFYVILMIPLFHFILHLTQSKENKGEHIKRFENLYAQYGNVFGAHNNKKYEDSNNYNNDCDNDLNNIDNGNDNPRPFVPHEMSRQSSSNSFKDFGNDNDLELQNFESVKGQNQNNQISKTSANINTKIHADL